MRRLLIANRGEIAIRIARTAHRLGIGTVGVYSEADRHALHPGYMDIAVAIGGETAAESYLDGDAVLAAALRTGCGAVHPGYGFLAENAHFARAVLDAGLAWVGPTPDQIDVLGDKLEAKRIAADAGVPVAAAAPIEPGGDIPAVHVPVMVKAAAGGGGRGMRIVRDSEALPDAVEAASREAGAAFGDGTVFIEPYLDDARHVEVQIIGDRHGSLLHLGTRDCSVQRRNQKVIEEAPAPGLPPEITERLLGAALALGNAVSYENAGTVEFLVANDDCLFLEMNTRLQVEHPVTEAITGLDLVELQLLVADGQPLPLTQDDVSLRGHAIEARLVAEDPSAGWLPSVGVVERFGVPDIVRVDSGVADGVKVGPHYDSLLAKLVASGPTRRDAVAVLDRALRGIAVAGVATNRSMLLATLSEPDFVAGQVSTRYLESHPDVLAGIDLEPDVWQPLLVGAVVFRALTNRAHPWSFAPTGWRNLFTIGQRSRWSGSDTVEVEERWVGESHVEIALGDFPVPDEIGVLSADDRTRLPVQVVEAAADRVVIEMEGVRHGVEVSRLSSGALLAASTLGTAAWRVEPRFEPPGAIAVGAGPVSPLPGTVIAVHVETGDAVQAGDLLAVVEAMKMEHEVRAADDGVVAEVVCPAGSRVEAGQVLIRLDEATYIAHPDEIRKATMTTAASPLGARTTLADVIPKSRARDVVLVVGFALLTTAAAQITIPLGFTPVPITGQTFAVLLAGGVLGANRGAASQFLYWGLGAVGLPFYTEAQGGWTVATGATAGYLAGFVVAAYVVGWMAERRHDRSPTTAIPAFLTGTVVIYTLGALWLSVKADVPLTAGVGEPSAIAWGVAPFLVGDFIKAVLAGLLLPLGWRLVGEPDSNG